MVDGMIQDIARNQRQGAPRLGKIMGIEMGCGSGTPSLFYLCHFPLCLQTIVFLFLTHMTENGPS